MSPKSSEAARFLFAERTAVRSSRPAAAMRLVPASVRLPVCDLGVAKLAYGPIEREFTRCSAG